MKSTQFLFYETVKMKNSSKLMSTARNSEVVEIESCSLAAGLMWTQTRTCAEPFCQEFRESNAPTLNFEVR